MLCAHTVRRLKPGTFEQFREVFGPPDEAPPGWVRFHMLRNLADPDEVVTFGFFDGTLEEMERGQQDEGYYDLRDRIEPLIASTPVNGVYEIVESQVADGAAAS